MLPTSVAVLLGTLAMGMVALAGFLWAWRTGQFRHLDRQGRVILSDTDERIARPWESSSQRAERRARHGSPLAPQPGEWGGAE